MTKTKNDMSRKRREFEDHNVVIVCEGTTTEHKYVRELCDYAIEKGVFPFTKYTLIPAMDQTPVAKNPNRVKKQKNLHGNKKELRYYVMNEESEEDYNKYCGQPTRYLREVQLFIEKQKFAEGWAVYDLDHHTDHEGAMKLLDETENLYVAFSSYSFEEWLLCHFERNPKAFVKSDCEDARKKSCRCGSSAPTGNDCHGNTCIAGHMREQGYIPEYKKNQDGLFKDLTLDEGKVRESVLINAAWLRYLHGLPQQEVANERFVKNPYSDMDIMVRRFLGDIRRVEWHHSGERFKAGGREMSATLSGAYLSFENCSNANIIIPNGSVTKIDGQELTCGFWPTESKLIKPDEELQVECSERLIRFNLDNEIHIVEA